MSTDRLPPERRRRRADPRGGDPRRADPRRADPRGAAGPARSQHPATGRHAAGGPARPAVEGGAVEGGAVGGGAVRGGDVAARPAGTRLPYWDRFLRSLAGVLAGGLAVLSLGLLVVWLLADGWGVPGPGGLTVLWHVIGAVVAVAGQRVADRRPDRAGTLAAVVVVGSAALVLGLAWFL